MRMGDFCGFRFGNVHSSDLHLVVVASSNRYAKEELPTIKEYTKEIPGGNGTYLFGHTFTSQEFSVSVAFDEVDEQTWRRISQLFATDTPQDLVFDELPFKTYRAKLKSKPEFKYICFNKEGQRVYKGEGTLKFVCYNPFAFGFNKYVVRAADYYKCCQPKEIITKSIEYNPYKKVEKPKLLPGLIKDHYNVKPNMSTPWKGGYPSIEQVQWGELYFNGENGKELIDIRDYFKNVPEWQPAAQLLTTPTLDFDRELIYMPQYSRTNYYNMDMGLNRQNGMIGSRVLVYNPGDMPIDFELRLGNLVSKYRANLSDNDNNYRFRISRYNVQRLSIEQAVDWCGLETYHREDNEEYKYGNRYFTILENNPNNEGKDTTKPSWWYEKEWDYSPYERKLGAAAPRHCYYVEPIPREKLGYFIRLFYWQSSHIDDPEGFTAIPCNFEKGIQLADRYEELYELCVTDEERYELYWKTLKEAILDCYKEVNEKIIYGTGNDGYGYDNRIFDVHDYHDKKGSYYYENFVHDYIYNPPEYIRENGEELDYGEFKFNVGVMPQYFTFDFIELNSNDFDKILGCECGCDCIVDKDSPRNTIKPLFIDSEKRMVYNVNNPEYDKNDSLKTKNFYDFKPTKKIFNDNIVKGTWFKLPPGWSIIEIAPVIDEDLWGGKRWLDSRIFNWGSIDTHNREHFDKIYWRAGVDWLAEANPYLILQRDWGIVGDKSIEEKERLLNENSTPEQIKEYLTQYCSKVEDLENYLQFKRWYEGDNRYDVYLENKEKFYDEVKGEYDKAHVIGGHFSGLFYEIQKRRAENAERGFLKRLDDYWRVNNVDVNGQPNGSIDDWWWFANYYSWENFPPLYWAYADLLNSIEIKYIPLFY